MLMLTNATCPAAPSAAHLSRITVKGKFLYHGPDKLYIKGVTYGTFRPHDANGQYPERQVVAEDFRLMAAQGINCVRTYTVPPTYLLDLALEHGLKVMVGLPSARS